jgi:hypothetical protein
MLTIYQYYELCGTFYRKLESVQKYAGQYLDHLGWCKKVLLNSLRLDVRFSVISVKGVIPN